jgi:hypothetical protein
MMIYKKEEKRYIFISFVLSVFVVIYTDYISVSSYGALVSFIMFFCVIILMFISFRKSLVIYLVMLFVLPSFPRQILDIYTAEGDFFSFQFNSIKYIKYLGFTLTQWLFAFFFIFSVRKLKKYKENMLFGEVKNIYNINIALLFLLIVGAMFSVLYGNDNNMREVLSDLKYPIMMLMGLLVGYNYYDSIADKEKILKDLESVLIVMVLVYGFNVILFSIKDRLSHFSVANYVTYPLISYVVLLILIFLKKNIKYSKVFYYTLLLASILSSIPGGRGSVIQFAALLIVYMYYIKKYNNDNRVLYKVIIYVPIIVSVLYYVIVNNEALYSYLSYKSLFFTYEIISGNYSQSPSVRLYEFREIVMSLIDSLYGLFIGWGAGGYFTYKHVSPSLILTVSDYSLEDIIRGMFYKPHTFVNYWLLKSGIIGLALYLLIHYQGLKIIKNIMNHNNNYILISYFAVSSIVVGVMQSYWQVEYLVFYLLIFVVLFLYEKNAEYKNIANN